MKTYKLTILVLLIAVALFLVVPSLSWAAEDGGALFKAKCAACHGADAAGKPAMKTPALKGNDKATADFILKGAEGKKAPHTKGIAGVNDVQAKAIADFIKTLK